ncbi:hypothetical protein GCM10007940_10970 [Portibacter lacus]|uniref:Uncharacterized protein n=1 Tax=Portibacter lacus TaxID=1099794 RepID=A0AA37WDW5_9BACT|nr:hypothetical protein GCM10007940_10970 [Portibacter lacus]
MFAVCCTKEGKEKEVEEVKEVKEVKEEVKDSFDIVGLWVEKFPELFDGVPDTIVFTEDLKIGKHFFYTDYNYRQTTDSLILFNDERTRWFTYEFSDSSEVIIYNFLDRSTSDADKDISFLKK